jgi:hypothetical protein
MSLPLWLLGRREVVRRLVVNDTVWLIPELRDQSFSKLQTGKRRDA